MSEYRYLCKTNEVAEGSAKAFTIDGRTIGLFHVDGNYYAIDNTCPHAGASLAHGYVEHAIVRCRIHHWGFCLKTGVYVDETNAKYNTRTYPVRVVGDDLEVLIGDRRDP